MEGVAPLSTVGTLHGRGEGRAEAMAQGAPALANRGRELGHDLTPVVKSVVELRLKIPDHERVLEVLPDVIPPTARREHFC